MYWWREQFNNARRRFNELSQPKRSSVAYGFTELIEVKLPNGNIKLEEIYQPGLLDFYTNQLTVSGTVFSLSGSPWSVETRRKIGIHMANIRYTDDGNLATMTIDSPCR